MPQNTRRASLLASALRLRWPCSRLACSAAARRQRRAPAGGLGPPRVNRPNRDRARRRRHRHVRPAGRRADRAAGGRRSRACCCSPATLPTPKGSAGELPRLLQSRVGPLPRPLARRARQSRLRDARRRSRTSTTSARPPGSDRTGYYAIMAGDWLVLMLNSNIPAGRGSPQWEFARQQLEAQRTPVHDGRVAPPAVHVRTERHRMRSCATCGRCSRPRARRSCSTATITCTSASRASRRRAGPPTNGIRQFTAGTGGAELYHFVRGAPNSEARITRYGVIGSLLSRRRRVGVPRRRRSVNDSGLDTCR